MLRVSCRVEKYDDVIYLSDDTAFLEKKNEEGKAVVLFLTEENRNADFSSFHFAVELDEQELTHLQELCDSKELNQNKIQNENQDKEQNKNQNKIQDKGQDKDQNKTQNKIQGKNSAGKLVKQIDENVGKNNSGIKWTVLSENDIGQFIDLSYLEKVLARCHKQPLILLESERLVVRELVVADAEDLLEIFGSEGARRFLDGFGNNIDEIRQVLRSYSENVYDMSDYGIWGVCKKVPSLEGKRTMEATPILGIISLIPREEEEFALELGFALKQDEQRKGYAEEMCRALLTHFNPEEKVIAYVPKENMASVHLLEKLGFHKTINSAYFEYL